MSLPSAIERVLTYRTPSGFYLAQLAEIQVLDLTGIGQGVFVETEHRPAAGNLFAFIVFKIGLLSSMVPNSFALIVRFAGQYLMNNSIVTSTVLRDGIDVLSIVTRNDPIAVRFTNNSTVLAPMVYQYGYTLHYLTVSSQENLDRIVELWNREREAA